MKLKLIHGYNYKLTMPLSFFFTSFCAIDTCFFHFLGCLLSNGSDRGLRVITAAAVRLWCLLAFACDELTACCDELTTCLWRVDRMTSQPCDELTGSLCTLTRSYILSASWLSSTRPEFLSLARLKIMGRCSKKSIKQLNRVSIWVNFRVSIRIRVGFRVSIRFSAI